MAGYSGSLSEAEVVKAVVLNINAKRIVYSLQKEVVDATREETEAALDKKIRLSANYVVRQPSDSKFIKYMPCQSRRRIIRMVEMSVDPMEPPKWKHKRIPKADSGSPPVPVMHSPPRPVTVKDQQDWRIPPCVSNWKNPKGYTIPLDKRLAADGREVRISDSFAELSEALYVAEHKAREAVAVRSKVQKAMMMKEKEKKEIELKKLARSDWLGIMPCETRQETTEWDVARKKRRHEEAASTGKKRKISRDIGEKVALGMTSTGGEEEVMYDQRLFNQEKGMDSGFATDDAYNQSAMTRPNKDQDAYGASSEEQLMMNFKAHDQDPFGLDRFLSDVMIKTQPTDSVMIKTQPKY